MSDGFKRTLLSSAIALAFMTPTLPAVSGPSALLVEENQTYTNKTVELDASQPRSYGLYAGDAVSATVTDSGTLTIQGKQSDAYQPTMFVGVLSQSNAKDVFSGLSADGLTIHGSTRIDLVGTTGMQDLVGVRVKDGKFTHAAGPLHVTITADSATNLKGIEAVAQSSLVLAGSTTIDLVSPAARLYGVVLGPIPSTNSVETASGDKSTLTTEGDLTIHLFRKGSNHEAVGIYLLGNTSMTTNGNLVIDSSDKAISIADGATLTLNQDANLSGTVHVDGTLEPMGQTVVFKGPLTGQGKLISRSQSLLIENDASGFQGVTTIAAGTTRLADTAKFFGGDVDIAKGAKLIAPHLGPNVVFIQAGGELVTSAAAAFGTENTYIAPEVQSIVLKGEHRLHGRIQGESGSETDGSRLTIADSGVYTAESLSAMKEAAGQNIFVSVPNAKVAVVVAPQTSLHNQTIELNSGIRKSFGIHAQEGESVTVVDTGTLTIHGQQTADFRPNAFIGVLSENNTTDVFGHTQTGLTINAATEIDLHGTSGMENLTGVRANGGSFEHTGGALRVSISAESATNLKGIEGVAQSRLELAAPTTISLTSPAARLYGVVLGPIPSTNSVEAASSDGTELMANNDLTIHLDRQGSGYEAVGVYLLAHTKMEANGKLTIDSPDKAIVIADGATLTLKKDAHIKGAISGAGHLVSFGSDVFIDGNASGFTGLTTIAGGTTRFADSAQFFGGNVTIADGATLVAPVLGAGVVTIQPGGELQTLAATAFGTDSTYIASDAASVVLKGEHRLSDHIQGQSGSETHGSRLTIADAGVYTAESLSAMKTAAGQNLFLSVPNATLAALDPVTPPEDDNTDPVVPPEDDDSGKSDTPVNPVTPSPIDPVIPVGPDSDAHTGTFKPGVTGLNTYTVALKPDAQGKVRVDLVAPEGTAATSQSQAQSLVFDAGDVITVQLDGRTAGSLQLLGHSDGFKGLITRADGQTLSVDIADNITLKLGDDLANQVRQGALKDVNLSQGATLEVSKFDLQMDSLSLQGQNATVRIGSAESQATVKVNHLTIGPEGTVFLDPAWKNDAQLDVIGNASRLEVSRMNALEGTLAVGQNSFVVVGASAQDAQTAIAQLNDAGLAQWGPNGITAALFVSQPIVLNGGRIVVDGAMTAPPVQARSASANTVTIASQGLLAIDQHSLGQRPAIEGTLVLENGSSVGVINAEVGTFELASETDNQGAVLVTDNPMIDATLDGTTLTTSLAAQNGVNTLAATGMAQMLQRADTVLARTVLDRVSASEPQTGLNLWVDVSGEHYRMDDLGAAQSMKSDMGYGTFGADVAVGESARVGAALQYGKGSVRSPLGHTKNDIQSWGLTAYGAYSITEKTQLIGQAAWVSSSNKIRTDRTAANGKYDADVLSLGVTAQYNWQAGAVRITPAVGLRYARLSLDAMQWGPVHLDGQHMNIWQVPLSVRLSTDQVKVGSWALEPALKVSFTPSFGDKKLEIGSAAADVIDTRATQIDFGLSARSGAVEFNANVFAGTGKYDGMNAGGRIGLKYTF